MKPKITQNERLYNIDIPVIGLTGGIATGKSTCSQIFKKKKLSVICADTLVKNIYQYPETIEFIASEVPLAVKDQQINFPLLRNEFFSDDSLKQRIEKFIYSHLQSEFINNVPADAALVVYDVPLLFEKNLQSKFDLTLLVYSDRETQKKRLLERDQISAELAEKILRDQMDIEEKRKLSDFIIDNMGTQQELEEIVLNFIKHHIV